MLKCCHDYSYCVTERLASSGKVSYEEYEITFVISASEKELYSISKVVLGDTYTVVIDWETGLVKHPTGHNDPVFIFTYNNSPALQIIYYHKELYDGIKNISVTLFHNDGQSIINSTFLNSYSNINMINSSFTGNIGDEYINIEPHSEEFEVVFQGYKNSRFFEERHECKSGKAYRFKLPIWFSDYYGICLSSKREVGGFEHKYMVMGNYGNGSGRHLLTEQGDILSPRVVEDYSMKSLLFHYTEYSKISKIALLSLLKDYREIEIAIDRRNGFEPTEDIFDEINKNDRLDYFFVDTINGADWLIYPNGVKIKSKFIFQDPFTFCFDKLKSRETLEISWMANISYYKANLSSYGVSFSYFRDHSEFSKEIIFDRKRKINPRSLCFNCANLNECEMIFPYPINRGFLEDNHINGECLIKKNLFVN